MSISFSALHVASLVAVEDNGKASGDHPLIAADLSSLLSFACAGADAGGTKSAFLFSSLRYSTFRLYFAAASGSLACRARTALTMK